MKVSQEVNSNAGVTASNKTQSGKVSYEKELKSETGRKNCNQKSTNSGPNTAWSRCYRLIAVCVLLLCVLLLAAVTALGISQNNLTLERDQIQQERSVLNRALVKLGWRPFSSSIYSISNETRSWNDTRQDCIRRGADLVIINSTEEEEFINGYFGSTNVWLGITDKNNKEEFRWVNGSPQNIVSWRFGKPQNYRGIQHCVSILPDLGLETVQKSYLCEVTVVGICEMKLLN